jgi:hypothetical protein
MFTTTDCESYLCVHDTWNKLHTYIFSSILLLQSSHNLIILHINTQPTHLKTEIINIHIPARWQVPIISFVSTVPLPQGPWPQLHVSMFEFEMKIWQQRHLILPKLGAVMPPTCMVRDHWPPLEVYERLSRLPLLAFEPKENFHSFTMTMSQDSALSIVTGFWLDGRGVWVLVGARFLFSPCCPYQL